MAHVILQLGQLRNDSLAFRNLLRIAIALSIDRAMHGINEISYYDRPPLDDCVVPEGWFEKAAREE